MKYIAENQYKTFIVLFFLVNNTADTMELERRVVF